MWGAVLAGQQGGDGVLQEHRDPVSHWLPELCAHICFLSGPGLGSWVLALSCWLCPGRGGRRRLGGGGGLCLPALARARVCVCVCVCVCVSRGGGAVWACLTEGHMLASRCSATEFALACVPTRLPVWLGYKRPRSTGGGQHVQVQLAGVGLWLRSGAVCGPRVSWCLRLSDCWVLWAGMPRDAGLCVHRELSCTCVGRRLGRAARTTLGVLACCVLCRCVHKLYCASVRSSVRPRKAGPLYPRIWPSVCRDRCCRARGGTQGWKALGPH